MDFFASVLELFPFCGFFMQLDGWLSISPSTALHLPNFCLTVCWSECLLNIVRYLVRRLFAAFRPIQPDPSTPTGTHSHSTTTSWLLFISWLGCLSPMICDFPAIYAKICDEISALPHRPLLSVCVYWTATVSCFSYSILKYLSSPSPGPTIFMRCARDARAPKMCRGN